MNKPGFNIFFLIICIVFASGSYSQTISYVHIVTDPKNRLQGFNNFHFTVNGISYRLKAGECLDLQVSDSGINIVVQDRRIIKQKTEELHTPAASDIYVWVLLKFNGTFKEPTYSAQLICKSCYEDRKKECRTR